MLSILFNNVKGCLLGGLGGILTDSLVMLNDFQLSLLRLCNSKGAGGVGGGVGVTDNPGMRIEKDRRKELWV